MDTSCQAVRTPLSPSAAAAAAVLLLTPLLLLFNSVVPLLVPLVLGSLMLPPVLPSLLLLLLLLVLVSVSCCSSSRPTCCSRLHVPTREATQTRVSKTQQWRKDCPAQQDSFSSYCLPSLPFLLALKTLCTKPQVKPCSPRQHQLLPAACRHSHALQALAANPQAAEDARAAQEVTRQGPTGGGINVKRAAWVRVCKG